jgi:Ca2+:H+ antiporter
MDLPASESEPLLQANDDPANSNHTEPRQVVVGPHIKAPRRRRVVTGAAEWIVQQLTSIKILLIFVPLGLGAGILKANAVVVSVFNFLAIIPLSVLLSDSSDKLSDILGPLMGQLINATFGNAVELTVS